MQKAKKTAEDPLLVFQEDNPRIFDPQLKQIVNLLAPRLKGIEQSADSVGFVTYQMYGVIRELITACITETPDLFDFASEVAVVGGIMINRRKVRNIMTYAYLFYLLHHIAYILFYILIDREETSSNHCPSRRGRKVTNQSICLRRPLVVDQICSLCLDLEKL